MQPSLRRPSRPAAIAALVFVNIWWGLSFLFSKTALREGLPPMTLAFLRYLITAAVMTPLCLHREGTLRLGRENIPLALASTLTGATVYFYFEYTGMTSTTASAASLIIAAVPMFTLLYRVLFARERPGIRRWLCVAGSMAGVFLVIVFSPTADDAMGALTGNLFILGAAVCWVIYIEVSTRLRRRASSLRITAWQAVAATVTLAPFALMERDAWVAVSPRAWLCILALALICSALCYFLYAEAMAVCDPVTTALSINLNPIAACLGGVLVLGERMTAAQLIGGAAILLCMLGDSFAGMGRTCIRRTRA